MNSAATVHKGHCFNVHRRDNAQLLNENAPGPYDNADFFRGQLLTGFDDLLPVPLCNDCGGKIVATVKGEGCVGLFVSYRLHDSDTLHFACNHVRCMGVQDVNVLADRSAEPVPIIPIVSAHVKANAQHFFMGQGHELGQQHD